MKTLIRSLVPPMLLEALKNMAEARTPTFDSYEQALSEVGRAGYQADELVKAVVEKNAIYRRHLSSTGTLNLDSLRTMIGLAAACKEQAVRVLDFGGGGGTHYAIARAVLGPDRNLRWNVVETTAMAAAASAKLGDENLRFFDDIERAAEDLGRVDLVFTSGALQYTPDPLLFLSRLLAVNANHVFLTRTALNNRNSRRVISVQTSWLSSNGPGPLPSGFTDFKVRYPVSFVPKSEVERIIHQGYRIRFSLQEEIGAYKANNQSFNMYGYFCDRKDSALM